MAQFFERALIYSHLSSSEAPIHQEEEKKNQEDMELSENSAYGSALSSAANSYHDMTPHSYQDVVIYEHVR